MNKELKLFQYEETIRMILEKNGEFRMYPKGTSMLPLIRQKKDSVVLVRPVKLLKNDIVFYKRDNGQYILHRILEVQKDGYVLCGDNQFVKEYGIRDHHVIGVVKAIWRENKYITLLNKKYRLYVWFICTCFPMRSTYLRMENLFEKVKWKLRKSKENKNENEI